MGIVKSSTKKKNEYIIQVLMIWRKPQSTGKGGLWSYQQFSEKLRKFSETFAVIVRWNENSFNGLNN